MQEVDANIDVVTVEAVRVHWSDCVANPWLKLGRCYVQNNLAMKEDDTVLWLDVAADDW